MAVKTIRQKYGLWLAKFSPFLSHNTLETSFPGLTSPHWKLSSTNHIRQSFSMSLMALPERSLFFFFRKSRDIIFRRAQLAEPRRREELLPRIRAHLLSVISKLQSFLEYQGVLNFTDALALLRRMEHSTLHD
jgi:hypothetical protein